MHQGKKYFNGASSSCSFQHSNHKDEESENLLGVKREKVGQYNGSESVFCDCNEPCRIATSWTLSNPGRRFHGCKNYGVFFLFC